MTARADELAQRLGAVILRVRQACDAVGRDAAEVTLIAVSKGWPASDIAIMRDLALADFGENRADELVEKAAVLDDPGIRWHFLGQIQSKKATVVGQVAHEVHSVDRDKLVPALATGADRASRPLGVFIQVSLAGLSAVAESGRGGASAVGISALADLIAAEPRLVLRGVMTLPPRDVEPAAAFGHLAAISAELRLSHPAASAISAGMSADLEAAIAASATHIRIGSALFGERTTLR